MIAVYGLMIAVRDILELGRSCPVKVVLNLLVQRALIALKGQYIIPTLINDLFSNLLLTAHGINGHNAIFDLNQPEQLRDGGDLIRFIINTDLPQN
jgi:hypothetical protein